MNAPLPHCGAGRSIVDPAWGTVDDNLFSKGLLSPV